MFSTGSSALRVILSRAPATLALRTKCLPKASLSSNVGIGTFSTKRCLATGAKTLDQKLEVLRAYSEQHQKAGNWLQNDTRHLEAHLEKSKLTKDDIDFPGVNKLVYFQDKEDVERYAIEMAKEPIISLGGNVYSLTDLLFDLNAMIYIGTTSQSDYTSRSWTEFVKRTGIPKKAAVERGAQSLLLASFPPEVIPDPLKRRQAMLTFERTTQSLFHHLPNTQRLWKRVKPCTNPTKHFGEDRTCSVYATFLVEESALYV